MRKNLRTQGGAVSVIVALVAVGPWGAIAAQEVMTVAIPSEKLACLLEYRTKYLELERNVIIFTPEYCPAISREEIQEFVQNSAEQDTSTTLLFLLKADFACLVNKIEAHFSSDEAADVKPTDVVEFQLDCE